MEEMNFRKPELGDQELIRSYIVKGHTGGCEKTFTNVFLWARFYQVTFAIIEDTLVFRTEGESGPEFSYPKGEPLCEKKALDALMAYCEENGFAFVLYHVYVEEFEQLEGWYPGQFQITYNRDYADYVYETEKLATLPGKKYHSKRNHINKFNLLYKDWTYETLSDENVEECFQMALKWRGINHVDDDEEKNAEMAFTMNSLRLFKELGLVGGLLRVNGEIAAFSVGEPINAEIFNVHIEKAFVDIEGAYPVINQQFVLHECMNYTYINREEDVGEEGLRKAKLSYRPAYLIEKGVVTRR